MTPLRIVAAFGLLLTISCRPTIAVGPGDVYLLVNRNDPGSREVADYYCRKRSVPADNVLTFDLPAREDCSRDDYDLRLVRPLRERLAALRDKPIVLAVVYGMPLRVGPKEPNDNEKKERDELTIRADSYRSRLRELKDAVHNLDEKSKGVRSPDGDELDQRRQEQASTQKSLDTLESRRRWLSYAESEAALDSELAMLWYDRYELRRWQLNLLYFQVPEAARRGKPPIVMTARLDGPSVAVVKRMIDDAVETEARGLSGKVYVDARGIRFDPKSETGHGYGGYDESMREMARLLQQTGKMTVVLDDRPELFGPGSCPDCALYCGWYSLGKYVDCCRFVPGAVAWHLASSEATTLRDPHTKEWCKNILENGAAATLGPVAEPYTIGFPKPAEFFGFLATGEYTLVECYWKTELFASWMTTLIGDPLYNPFKKNPRLKIDDVKPSPAGADRRSARRGDLARTSR
jgi:uncharacterized protein (TIGR03790 family)